MTLERLNDLDPARAAARVRALLRLAALGARDGRARGPSRAWRRSSRAAERVWWRSARGTGSRRSPRIRGSASRSPPAWSAGEQARRCDWRLTSSGRGWREANAATSALRPHLHRLRHRQSAAEMLAMLEARLANEPGAELRYRRRGAAEDHQSAAGEADRGPHDHHSRARHRARGPPTGRGDPRDAPWRASGARSAAATTDADGRVPRWPTRRSAIGIYRLTFDTGAYHRDQGITRRSFPRSGSSSTCGTPSAALSRAAAAQPVRLLDLPGEY